MSHPSAHALIISDEWVSGSIHTMSPTTAGSALTENIVPHRNVIGIMTRLVNTFIDALDFARRPAATPSRAKVVHENRVAMTTAGPMTRSSVRKRPRPSRIIDPSIPLMSPITDFPNTMAEVCIGESISSSKLVWNSLWIMSFWAVDVNPAVMDDIAMIPGMA